MDSQEGVASVTRYDAMTLCMQQQNAYIAQTDHDISVVKPACSSTPYMTFIPPERKQLEEYQTSNMAPFSFGKHEVWDSRTAIVQSPNPEGVENVHNLGPNCQTIHVRQESSDLCFRQNAGELPHSVSSDDGSNPSIGFSIYSDVETIASTGCSTYSDTERRSPCTSSDDSGRLICWGCAEFGQHGHQSGGDVTYGEGIASLGDLQNTRVENDHVTEDCFRRIKNVGCGSSHTVIVTDAGAIYVWGNGNSGQLGIGEMATCRKARRLHIGHTCSRCSEQPASVCGVSCGARHTIFLLTCGHVFSCGNNFYAQLGYDFQVENYKENQVSPRWLSFLRHRVVKQVSCGDKHTLILFDDGVVATMGNNLHGQLGTDGRDDCVVPKALDLDKSVIYVCAGANHSLVITADHTVLQWGYSRACGRQKIDILCPENVQLTRHVLHVAAGGAHSLALTVSGCVYSWGSGLEGQLGHGTRICFCERPRRLLYGKFQGSVSRIACGDSYSAAITANGLLYMWGRSNHVIVSIQTSSFHVYEPICMNLGSDPVRDIICGAWHAVCVTGLPDTSDIVHGNEIFDSSSSESEDELQEENQCWMDMSPRMAHVQENVSTQNELYREKTVTSLAEFYAPLSPGLNKHTLEASSIDELFEESSNSGSMHKPGDDSTALNSTCLDVHSEQYEANRLLVKNCDDINDYKRVPLLDDLQLECDQSLSHGIGERLSVSYIRKPKSVITTITTTPSTTVTSTTAYSQNMPPPPRVYPPPPRVYPRLSNGNVLNVNHAVPKLTRAKTSITKENKFVSSKSISFIPFDFLQPFPEKYSKHFQNVAVGSRSDTQSRGNKTSHIIKHADPQIHTVRQAMIPSRVSPTSGPVLRRYNTVLPLVDDVHGISDTRPGHSETLRRKQGFHNDTRNKNKHILQDHDQTGVDRPHVLEENASYKQQLIPRHMPGSIADTSTRSKSELYSANVASGHSMAGPQSGTTSVLQHQSSSAAASNDGTANGMVMNKTRSARRDRNPASLVDSKSRLGEDIHKLSTNSLPPRLQLVPNPGRSETNTQSNHIIKAHCDRKEAERSLNYDRHIRRLVSEDAHLNHLKNLKDSVLVNNDSSRSLSEKKPIYSSASSWKNKTDMDRMNSIRANLTQT